MLTSEAQVVSAQREVALAEDDDALRSLVATMLRRAGYVVREFSSGSQLLRTLAPAATTEPASSEREVEGVGVDHEIGLVISDIRMPGASGLDVLTKLHHAKLTIPVVLMTAFGDRLVHEKALQLGAAALIDKPFELDELIALATRLLPG